MKNLQSYQPTPTTCIKGLVVSCHGCMPVNLISYAMLLHKREEKTMKAMMLLSLMALAQFASGQGEILESYRWKNRIVLLFGPHKNATVQKQLAELEKDTAGMTDRDLLIFHIDTKETRLINQSSNPALSAKQLRSQYKTGKNEFRYILIGKDGGVKLDKKEFVAKTRLFSVIDAMPMRQREMRKRK